MIQLSKRTMWIITALYALALVMVSVLPSGKGVLYGWDQGIKPSVQDALHVPAYAVLVVLASMAWLLPHNAGYGRVLAVAMICCVFGAVLEAAQVWIPGRGASLTDALLNVAGALVGGGALAGWRFLTNARKTPLCGATSAGQEERG